jgi:maltooligosyltrehalose trehalohydrolase
MNILQVWAPDARTVEVEVAEGRHPMAASSEDGWWSIHLQSVTHEVDYLFRLDRGDPLSDPRSLRQPFGIDGPSRTYDHSAFRWSDVSWRGVPLHGSIVYELHVGAFTHDGTFDAAIRKLPHLKDLGVDIVELMPVAAFPGHHGWGYDPVNLWAVHEPYGGPDGLKRLVDACHASGLAVLLDVVYNHVGPGSTLAAFGPYFTDAHSTPWGPAINLDQKNSNEVRAFLISNALSWLRDYHVDGLRLDAVDMLRDRRAIHFLEELAVEVQALAGQLRRELILIAESSANNSQMVAPREAGGYGLTAQWNNDFHHAVHVAITGEKHGRYCEFGSVAVLAKTLTRVFFHDGTWSAFRRRNHGRPVDVSRTPAYRFLGYLQNHDQIGNRAIGDRISAVASTELLKVGAGLMLTAPYTPMLFMGEEWGANTPWQYFTDHIDEKAGRTAAEGRRAEFSADGRGSVSVPDPQDQETFLGSKLDWSQLGQETHRELLSWYRGLITLRRSRPEFIDPRLDQVSIDYEEDEKWLVVRRGRLRIVVNLDSRIVRVPLDTAGTGILIASNNAIQINQDRITMPGESFAVIET